MEHGAAQQAAVWSDVQNSIGTISELFDHCMAAYGPDNSEKVLPTISSDGRCFDTAALTPGATPQAISLTTKRRLSARAVQGLKGGKELLKVRPSSSLPPTSPGPCQ
jgi:hypothetical protein